MNLKRAYRYFTSLGTGLLALTLLVTLVAAASQTDILGPAGSSLFGTSLTALPNGNLVVTDPDYDAGSNIDVGAVHLYDGGTGLLISTLTGSNTDDNIGSSGVIVLTNGNFVVNSPSWDSSGLMDAGAVTWGSGISGVSGVVSAANSLVGSTASDRVGSNGVTELANGNYVVASQYWDNGGLMDAGAVTWGNGASGVIGVVSAANSLVGSTASDQIGTSVMELTNGNYVVASQTWDNGGLMNAGAVTWGSGTGGVSGGISAANSLVGSRTNDRVGTGVTALTNGNYVVESPSWDNGATTNVGAVTWGSGISGIIGAVSTANSLVGGIANDYIGSLGVTALGNGNYVVRSQYWDNGAMTDAGAVTWGNGSAGFIGLVSAANSLVGSRAFDEVGSSGVTELANGNYVVSSRTWDNGAVTDAGAVTWGSGTAGITGAVSAANSLVGSIASDRVGTIVTGLVNGNYVVSSLEWHNGATTNAGAVTWGSGTSGISGGISATNSLVGSTANDYIGVVMALVNGNYVVLSQYWDNGTATDAGVVTWGNGISGVSGVVSAANSLVGSTASDEVGSQGVTGLANGNYVVSSPSWDNGAMTDAGAATWGSGTAGISGVVSAANSLVGSTASDRVGSSGVTGLTNGNYVVSSPLWDSSGLLNAGAVTWGGGTSGVSGGISATNSLVGSTVNDQVGANIVTALAHGNYVVSSLVWDNGSATNAGAVTWGSGESGTKGPITTDNSVLGETTNGGPSMNWVFDRANHQLVVGRPADNIVTLFHVDPQVLFLPIMVR